MNTQVFSLIYGAVLHVGALVSLVVLVAIGKVPWADAGPIIGGLVGVGVGVPLTFSIVNSSPPPAPAVAPADPAKVP